MKAIALALTLSLVFVTSSFKSLYASEIQDPNAEVHDIDVRPPDLLEQIYLDGPDNEENYNIFFCLALYDSPAQKLAKPYWGPTHGDLDSAMKAALNRCRLDHPAPYCNVYECWVKENQSFTSSQAE
jgi:hypothetical protein